MKALIFKGSNKKELIDREKPKIIKSTDAIVKVMYTTICGTDLHILKGDVPEVPMGLTLGHEGVGIVEEVGDNVNRYKVGDPVLISCITSCGGCEYCKKGLPSHCEDGGWILGHLINGTQAEYVRIPHADNSLYPISKNIKAESMVMMSDIIPTGFEIGVLNGKVFPGSTVAIVGAGPIGLATLLTAKFYTPAEIIMIDLDENRLKIAKEFGATYCINSSDGKAIENVMKYTKNRGVDVSIEAVGVPATFDICQSIVTAGGFLAVIGVHGKSVDFHLEKLWIQNIKLTTGLVNTTSTPTLLKIIEAGDLKPETLITHHFKLTEIMKAYDIFSNAAQNQALKVIISND
jgi:alcohol dehydrogenase